MIYTVYDSSGRYCGVVTTTINEPIIEEGYFYILNEQSKHTRLVNNTVESFSEKEIFEIENQEALNRLRSIRKKLLSDSDWTQALDAPVDQAAWAIYRQALRDLPQTVTDPKNPDWPTPPS